MLTAPTSFPWLSLLLALPLTGAGMIWLFRRQPEECRWFALATTLTLFAVCVWLFLTAPAAGGRWFLYEDLPWIERYGIRYTLGLDGLSLLMVLLTAFLQVLAVLISWPVQRHVPLFFILVLVMQTGILGVFLALDLFLFYVFWEVMLIPMFFLIGIWGHARRIYAALKFFLFTLAGSLLMLLGIIALYWLHGSQTGHWTFALEELRQTGLTGVQEFWIYAGFMLAFAIKAPLVPFHTWLPDAHTEAPTAGSLDLAGLLLKTGAYAMLRFAFTLFPAMAQASFPLLAGLALAGLFHASWSAYVQQDIKRLIAYSSVAHIGLVILGFAAWNTLSLEGSILMMVAHGITTGGLFALVAMLEARTGTRRLDALGGLWSCSPRLAACFLFFTLAALGLPGLGNFAGEILVLLGAFQAHPAWGILGMAGTVFAAAYMLRLARGVLWGPQGATVHCHDLTLREALILGPMIGAILWLGLHPATFLAPLQGTVAHLLQESAQTLAGGAP